MFNPWYIIAWRLLWFLPAQALRMLFTLVVGIGFGRRAARDVWRDTR